MRLECFNSVNGSTRFRALLGWFRFICSNGMVIGVIRSDVLRRHVGDLGLGITVDDNGQKNPQSLAGCGFKERPWMSLDCLMVELSGIEPLTS